eukprot:scaffold349_cov157-Skeletonema_dohrnii-CCMP3373.AAC.3
MEECAKDMGQRRNHAALQCTNKVREEECAYLKVWHAGTLCSIDGCKSQAKNGGVCIKHGHEAKKKRCRIEGCTNNVIKGGVCIWHGAKVEHGQRCSIDRCKRGICVKTGAKDKLCNKEILTNEAYRQEKMCIRHGMKEPCAIDGITTQVRNGQNGRYSFKKIVITESRVSHTTVPYWPSSSHLRLGSDADTTKKSLSLETDAFILSWPTIMGH